MQQRVGECRLLLEIGGFAQNVFQRMTWRQCPKRRNQVTDSSIGGTDTHASAKLLQQVNASPSIGRIHHQMHCSLSFEYVVQSCEPRIGIREMMENSCANNLVEARFQPIYLLDG